MCVPSGRTGYDWCHTGTGNNTRPGYVVMTMSEFDLEATIRDLREAVDGDVLSRNRVVDALLDLRLDAVARADVVEMVDQALAAVPGKNMVPADWWREQLDMFALAAINLVEPVS